MARQQRSTTLTQESTRPITHVALYARVSTLNNQDPEMQLAELREYAGRRGWQIVEEFTDQGVSGCKESRPALNRLMSDACRRRFDAVLVWKIDRFGIPRFSQAAIGDVSFMRRRPRRPTRLLHMRGFQSPPTILPCSRRRSRFYRVIRACIQVQPDLAASISPRPGSFSAVD